MTAPGSAADGAALPPPDATLVPAARDGGDPLAVGMRTAVEQATTARLFLPGGPSAYDTGSWLRLRADHAAARDAVHRQLDLTQPGLAALARHEPIELETAAPDAARYLTRPELGRRLSGGSAQALVDRMGPLDGEVAQLALIVGDGLSATAVEAHAGPLVDALLDGAARRGWRVRTPVVVVHRCRVGILNDLGPRVGADVVILLIGERPGLAAADSLSAYLAHRPLPGHTDAERNLVSGIHDRGTPVAVAAARILDLAGLLLGAGRSGVSVKEELGPLPGEPGSLPAVAPGMEYFGGTQPG